MRLTLWQQFSSNHSARFTVVGQFETIEQAQRAYGEFNEFADKIVAWYHAHPELDEGWVSGDPPEPTEPELQFNQQYKVEWDEYSVAWFPQTIRLLHDNLVIIDSDGQSDGNGANPFHLLMQKMGGKVVVEGDIFHGEGIRSNFSMDLQCVASDETSLNKLAGEIGAYFAPRETRWEKPRRWKAAPWELYGNRYELWSFVSNAVGIKVDTSAGTPSLNLMEKVPLHVKRTIHQSVMEWLGNDEITREMLENYVNACLQLQNYGFMVSVNWDNLPNAVDEIIRTVIGFSKYGAVGKIRVESEKIVALYDVGFRGIVDGLPALVSYLKDHSCAQFQYRFKEYEDED
jgi:hypothetical protein